MSDYEAKARELALQIARYVGVNQDDTLDTEETIPFILAALQSAHAAGVAHTQQIVAMWMINHGHATGHGDTIDDLLAEFAACARAAGKAEGDRAEYERGVRDAQAQYKQLHDWIAEQISRAKYNADELGQGLKAWDDIADSMRNGIMASFADNVLALLTAQPKGPT